MLNRLRRQLTGLYFLAALALLLIIGGGTYSLLHYYFQSTTDLALQHRMAHEFRLLGAPLPAELAAADSAWYVGRPPNPRSLPTPVANSTEGDGFGAGFPLHDNFDAEATFNGELAAIYTLTLNTDGVQLVVPGASNAPLPDPDGQAAAAAWASGYDWRTVRLSSGERVRLLTYRLSGVDGSVLVQMGRPLADQDRILNRLLVGLLTLGGLSAIGLSAASWFLAGRTLGPAQQAMERQQAFVSNASHELRAPLTLIRASAEVAQRTGPAGDDEWQTLIGDVLQESDHMSRLVEDLLLLSRLDSGRIELAHVPVALADLLEDVGRQVGRVAAAHGVELTRGETAGRAWGDPVRLRQVLLILLDNALQHTPSGGGIQLSASAQGRQVRIVVADTGHGIPPEHLPHVFERFYRVDSTRNGNNAGAGLGLAIAKSLVEAQHGRIWLESDIAGGTKAIITLPAAAS